LSRSVGRESTFTIFFVFRDLKIFYDLWRHFRSGRSHIILELCLHFLLFLPHSVVRLARRTCSR
jgi:hypothetical protein